MFCPKCGTANNDENRFCHQCSAALPTQDAQTAASGGTAARSAPTAGSNRRKNPLKRILAVVALLVVAFFVYAALSPDDPASGGSDAAGTAAADAALASASGGDAPAEGQSGTADNTASASSDASAAASPAAVEEVGDILTMDVFDWNLASDDMKKKIAFACQTYWNIGGITGEPIDIDSGELAKKIDAAMGEQAMVFDTACALYNIDPSQWKNAVN